MKRLLCAVAAIAMIAPTSAGAQNQTQHRPGTTKPAHPEHNRPGRPHRPSPPVTIQPVKPNRPHRPNRPKPPVTIQPIKPNRPYRPGHRPPHFRPIHRPGFQYPHGYRYRRWHIGLFLPHIFLSAPYYWTDWAALGLYPPPPGFVWVRYGPDLLLVNRHTGRIRDVIYGAFY
jgi:Ni/Co efflux regulator RcnB